MLKYCDKDGIEKTIIDSENINDYISGSGVSVECYHNVPRLVPKDITSYITDGTFWQRLNGTDGFKLFEDIYCGDYIRMSRPISAYERTGQYQAKGSQYVTIAGLDSLWGNGDSYVITYHHAVMIPGQGFGGTQHFGRSRMNPEETKKGGYYSSEMNLATLGSVTSSGSTASTASINQQLYAEFGSHLKTTRELLSNSLYANGYNRYGIETGCTNRWAWYSCQAVLMSEVEVYGSIVWSSSGYDTGNACNQLPLFRHVNSARNNRSAWYWLKDVTNGTCFACCSGLGNADIGYVTDVRNVRPRFVIGA